MESRWCASLVVVLDRKTFQPVTAYVSPSSPWHGSSNMKDEYLYFTAYELHGDTFEDAKEWLLIHMKTAAEDGRPLGMWLPYLDKVKETSFYK